MRPLVVGAGTLAVVLARLLWLVERRLVRALRAPPSPPASSATRSMMPRLLASRSSGPETGDDFLYVAGTLSSFLSSLIAVEWCRDGADEPLHVREHATAACVLAEMRTRRLTRAVVCEAGTLLGAVDTSDVLRYVLRPHTAATSARRMLRCCAMLAPTTTLEQTCRALSRGHRYLVATSADGPRLVSQRAVVEAIVRATGENERLRTELSVLRVEEVATTDVLTCHEHDSARHAVERMACYGVTSLPILRAEGTVLGVISATDALYALEDENSLLDASVCAFVDASRRAANDTRPVHSVVACAPRDSLLDAVRTMMYERVHHVYVLVEDAPAGVLSFSDVLRAVLEVVPHPPTSNGAHQDELHQTTTGGPPNHKTDSTTPPPNE